MEKIKLLLYCTRQPHKLFNTNKGFVLSDFELGDAYKDKNLLNGKIVAECDFEVEKIECRTSIGMNGIHDEYTTKSLGENELLYASKIDEITFINYLKGKNGYAIHIKNLNIFDKPRELDYYTIVKKDDTFVSWHLEQLKQAPQNMMRIITRQEEDVSAKWVYHKYSNACIEVDNGFREHILISIRPEWLVKILNHEKTIEIRKRVLKGML